MRIQSDGKIVVAGYGGYDFALARYENYINSDGDDTWQTDRDVGVIPGVHAAGKIIEDPADEDWYQFELLKADDVQFDVTFNSALGTLSFDLLQIVAGVPVVHGSSTATTPVRL